MSYEGYTPGWGTFCLWSAPFSLYHWSLVFLSCCCSPVRGWTAISLSSSGCVRVSWALAFGWTSSLSSLLLSPVAVDGRKGEPGAGTISPRSRDCADGTERGPFTATPSERAGSRHVQARGTSSGTTQEGPKERSQRDDALREVVTPFFFSLGLCKCLWEAPSLLK